MILIDLSQTLYSVLLQNNKTELSLSMARGWVYMTLLSYKKQFGNRYGDPVLAIDSNLSYWRRDIHPNYKRHRQNERAKNDNVDWTLFHEIVNTLTEEIMEYLPWKTIRIDRAEADDIIGVLAAHYGKHKDVLILSSDKDYKQLQGLPKVNQYSPIMKKWIVCDDPERALRELIIEGDNSDGIPNIINDIDCIFDGTPKKRFMREEKERCIADPAYAYRHYGQRYLQNEQLIDLSKIPDDIQQSILEAFNHPPKSSLPKLFQYFMRHRMQKMMSDIDLFKIRTKKNEAYQFQ